MNTWKYIAVAVLAIGVLSAGVRVATLALFTDTQSVGANTFSTGTVDIATNPASALITFSNMAPGDVVTPVNGILVDNTSTLQLRYAISSSATSSTPELKDQLVLIIREVDADLVGCGSFDGAQLYTGDMDSTDGKLVGDNAQGAQAGDRPLDAGVDETLCFRGELPIGTGNTYQNKTTTVTFTFDAEQTANNP